MARRRGKPFNKKVISALITTPVIVLGSTKRTRRSAANKWLKVLTYAAKN